jgi:hypothetical protein
MKNMKAMNAPLPSNMIKLNENKRENLIIFQVIDLRWILT